MNERVKLIREFLKISQEDFGKRIGLVKSSISNIENGTRSVTDKHIKLICIEFNVNEEWLRFGRGEMFKDIPEEDEVASYVSELLEDDGSNPIFTLIKEIMHTYDQLDNKSQGVLKDYAIKLLENLNTKKEG